MHIDARFSIPARPVITRTTAQIAASLTPEQQAEVDDIASILAAMRQENPDAVLPDNPTKVYLLAQIGVEFDFQRRRWVWTEDVDGADAAYRPTERGLELVETMSAYAFPGEGLQLLEVAG